MVNDKPVMLYSDDASMADANAWAPNRVPMTVVFIMLIAMTSEFCKTKGAARAVSLSVARGVL